MKNIVIVCLCILCMVLAVIISNEEPEKLPAKVADDIKEETALSLLAEDIKKIYDYDSNDPIYKFIPEAPDDWIEKFGDSERTRLIHSISELRVVVGLQGKRIVELEDMIKTLDWSNQ